MVVLMRRVGSEYGISTEDTFSAYTSCALLGFASSWSCSDITSSALESNNFVCFAFLRSFILRVKNFWYINITYFFSSSVLCDQNSMCDLHSLVYSWGILLDYILWFLRHCCGVPLFLRCENDLNLMSIRCRARWCWLELPIWRDNHIRGRVMSWWCVRRGCIVRVKNVGVVTIGTILLCWRLVLSFLWSHEIGSVGAVRVGLVEIFLNGRFL